MKEYQCRLSKTGKCKYGGNKRYNYGFMQGSSQYCYKCKRFLEYVKECPLKEENN